MATPNNDKEWSRHPKFRHNLWTTFADEPEITYLTASHGKFEVATSEAREFLNIRGFCTGHHSLDEIAARSTLPPERTREIIESLIAGDLLRRPYQPFAALEAEEIRHTLLAASRIWSDQLRETHIAVDVFNGAVARQVAIGWLLETYHYIRSVPAALDVAVAHAHGELRDVLARYADQERGHEGFVEQSLLRLDLTQDEIRHSIPLVTTRLIDLLMRELFARTPCAALLVAALVEADDFGDDELPALQRDFSRHYNAPADCLAPLFRHSQIDADLGHGKLAERHAHLLRFDSEAQLNDTVNKLHDLKHAFDAQNLEIKDYYGRLGNYFPRQSVDYFAI
jgi:hypothetical protein